MATVSESMATKLSDLDDQKSGGNIQTEGHTLTPPSGQNSPEETEAFGNTTSHSPSQSWVRKPAPDHPETQYCLEIQVISTEDWGMTPPLAHLAGTSCGRHGPRWQVWPNRRVVTDPSWAVCFMGGDH